MNMIHAIFNFFYEIFFGCAHERQTRPFTLQEETYKVCLDCGSHIYYSPVTMRPLNTREVRRMKATRSGEVRVLAASTTGPTLVSAQSSKPNAA